MNIKQDFILIFKTMLIMVAIMALAVGSVSYFVWKKSIPHNVITKEQAESIASPILKRCWNSPNSKVESFSTSFLNQDKEFSFIYDKPFWRVGGNIKGVPMLNNTYGNIPEVFIDASTGKIFNKHFTELGPPLYPDCEDVDSNGEYSGWYIEIARSSVEELLTEEFKTLGGASDYRINMINFIGDKVNGPSKEYASKGYGPLADSFNTSDSLDSFIVTVDYSVKPIKLTERTTVNWIAGNGQLSDDG